MKLSVTKKHTSTCLLIKWARNRVVSQLRNTKMDYFHKLNPSNPKQFWKSAKILNKQNSSIPVQSQDSNVYSTDQEKADVLNSFFCKNFNYRSKNQPGLRRSDPLKSSPSCRSLSVSDSVRTTSSCSLLSFPLLVSLAPSRLRCLCFSVSISNW